MFNFEEITGFDWDKGNVSKNLVSHKVFHFEAEQIFFNQPLFITEDEKHSQDEKRSYCLGKSDNNRLLYVSFTLRKSLIRIISARDMSRKERKKYNENKKKDSDI